MRTGDRLKQIHKKYGLNKYFYPWFAWFPIFEGEVYSKSPLGGLIWLKWIWRKDNHMIKGNTIIRRIPRLK